MKENGGVIHFFAVGRVFEQEDVGWLREIVKMGHSVGNHKYDHVYGLCAGHESRSGAISLPPRPWLIHGMSVPQALAENTSG